MNAWDIKGKMMVNTLTGFYLILLTLEVYSIRTEIDSFF